MKYCDGVRAKRLVAKKYYTIQFRYSILDSYINAFHATGECRRQVKNDTNFEKNVKIVKFHDHIWNHLKKHIEMSTNMPGMGSVIHELAVKISEIRESKYNFAE